MTRGNMGVIPERKDYKNCSKEQFTRFIEELDRSGICNRVAYTPAAEKSHFDRYGYACDNKRISVVYDNKANMLSLTAMEDTMVRLNEVFMVVKSGKNAPQNKVKVQEKQKDKPKQAAAPKPNQKQVETPKAKQKQTAAPKNDPKPRKAAAKTEKTEQKSENNKPQKKTNVQAVEVNDEPHGDFSLKKYTPKRFEGVIEKLKKDKKKYKLTDDGFTDKGKPTELRTYTVASNGQKLKLRFMTKKQVLQLQGKHGALFSELQVILSEESDYKAAVSALIESRPIEKKEQTQPQTATGKAGKVERQLKKLIPNAFDFLSEQSKIDFTIGVIEIINSDEHHYDYSMLLLPPFRGLERLIFDLQRAQGIEVKMIGQAYEKEEGLYVLKASYRRKINSIVYAEVMADLYREYFETRNYYAHTDNSTVGGVRMINRKEQAAAIFDKMLKLVDYNCKKLSEIGFSTK